jgi:serine/threonine-protein kinase
MAEQKSSSTSFETELARTVVDLNLATPEEINEARQLLQNQRDSGRSLPDVLVAQGIITERQMRRVQKGLDAARNSRQIPGYQILSKLGAGAMATVFKARQLSLDRIVAIKVLPREMSENREYVERFYKEGKAAAKLNHPNIVQAIDVGEAGGYHYFVMEYVEGRTLHDDLAAGKVFSEAEALDVIMQVAKALEHAHKQGFIHRDVKPKNIMITPEGLVKLADMGLARAASDVQAARAEAGRAFGTPYYISPEQIRGEVNIDFRADIYSLGATLYHLVTGRVPFEGSTPAAVMHCHLKDPLVPPDHLNTNLSAGLGEVVETMMAKDRSKRYASTSDLLIDLEAISNGQPPLQARRNIDASMLSHLANAAPVSPASEETHQLAASSSSLLIYVILLAAALMVSVLINVVQALR